MRLTTFILGLLLSAATPTLAQTSWFQPALLERPDVRKAMQSIDDRSSAIVDEWIRLVEIPAPSKKEQARAQYIRAEMEKLGLADIRVDDMFNVSGVRKGSGGGPTVVFAAHMDTVFPEGTDLRVKREGDVLRAPGVGDDTSNLMAVLEMFRALNRGGVQTKGDLVFLASVQEELGLLGARHWLETSGYKPDMFIAVDVSSNQVWRRAPDHAVQVLLYLSWRPHDGKPRRPSPAKALAKAIDAVLDPASADRRGARLVRCPSPTSGRSAAGRCSTPSRAKRGSPAICGRWIRRRSSGSSRPSSGRRATPPIRSTSGSGWRRPCSSTTRRRGRGKSG